ncbi:MAG TPA: DUF3592 domain-containing protein [Tepidisphaeraceae bacterium]|jgi:hypothetical protein
MRTTISQGSLPIKLSVFFGLAGLILAGVGASAISECLLAQHWPAVEGTVLQSRVWRDSAPNHGGLEDHCAMQYLYLVHGKTYTSQSIACDANLDTELAVVRNHPQGSKVLVFYNPGHPAKSYLATSIAKDTIIVLLFGCALLAMSVTMILRSI